MYLKKVGLGLKMVLSYERIREDLMKAVRAEMMGPGSELAVSDGNRTISAMR